MRWVLLERILELGKGRICKTLSRLPEEGSPSAGVLLIEMMAQTAGLLAGAESGYERDIIFAKIERAFFENLAPAGAEIVIEAVPDQAGAEGGWFEASVFRQGGKIAGARLLLMNAGLLVPGAGTSVTFHRAFMDHYRVYEHLKAGA